MQFFKYFIVGVVILALVIPADAGWLRRTWRKVKKGVKKVIKNTGKAIKKIGCKALFRFVCPVAVTGAGAALAAGTSGTTTAIVGAGVALGNRQCRLRSRRCKRSVGYMEVDLPFSDEVSDYDRNGDKTITYEEFSFAVMRSIGMVDYEELRVPFLFADANGDDKLDVDEFKGAPFLFAHPNHESLDKIFSRAA